MAYVFLFASTFTTPVEVDQSPIEVEIIFGHWKAKETLIEMLDTHAIVSRRRGISSYILGLIFLLPIHLTTIMVI